MATSPTNGADYSQPLRQLMQQANINSYRQLSQAAGVSRWAINLLRQGQVHRLRVEALQQLSQTLNSPVAALLATFSGDGPHPQKAAQPPGSGEPHVHKTAQPLQSAASTEALQREYERLQQRLIEQEAQVRQQVQADAIAILESWLVQWPTALNAVQQNPNLPAARLIPLTKPLDALLHAWDLVPIGTVGEETSFDPQIHQPMSGNPQVGELTRIRYVGYRHGERLLYRAKVSPAS